MISRDDIVSNLYDIERLTELAHELNIKANGVDDETITGNKKMKELEDYCFELISIAEIALESKPQLLTKLGVHKKYSAII
jgi:hypothetical protein